MTILTSVLKVAVLAAFAMNSEYQLIVMQVLHYLSVANCKDVHKMPVNNRADRQLKRSNRFHWRGQKRVINLVLL